MNKAYPTKKIGKIIPPKKLIIIKWIGPTQNNKFKCNNNEIDTQIFNIKALPYLSNRGVIVTVPIIPPIKTIEVITVI